MPVHERDEFRGHGDSLNALPSSNVKFKCGCGDFWFEPEIIFETDIISRHVGQIEPILRCNPFRMNTYVVNNVLDTHNASSILSS